MALTTSELCSASAEDTETIAIRVLQELERAGVTYCVLRGGDQLHREDDEQEVDLLVPPQQIKLLGDVLRELGFVRLRTWGHSPHHFFVAYDEQLDRWLKLDVVTEVAYGRPTHELSTELADQCLLNRRRVGLVFIPAPADELVTLLLHCVVDKGTFPDNWQYRLQSLCLQIDNEDYVTDQLSQYWSPGLTCDTLRSALTNNDWDFLLAARQTIQRRLATRNRFRTITSRLRDQLLRKLNHLALVFRPHALSVAVLAPDGAGKSTLAEGVCEHFFFPVDQIYMGLYQKRESNRALQLPGLGLIGKMVTQWQRYLQGYAKRVRGRFVIFDRYSYDALLPARHALSRLQRVRRWLLAYSCPAPNVMLMLDAPGEVLFARKGEHSAEYLEQHRQAYLKLRKQFPQLIVVDAMRDADQVRRSAVSHIWRRFARQLQ